MNTNLNNFAFSTMQFYEMVLIVAAFLIGYRIAGRLFGIARAVVIFQLMLFMIVGVVVSLQCGVKLTHPVEAVLSVCLGGLVAAGQTYWRKKKSSDQQREIELKLRNKQLEESRLLLVKNDEMDRRLLAADLHDQILNDLKIAMKHLSEYRQTKEESKADRLTLQLNQTMSDIRELMDNLNPVMLECFGLRAGLEDCAESFARRGGFKVDFVCDVDEEKLNGLQPVEQQLLFRLVQESLTNIYKHALAKNVSVRVSEENQLLSIQVTDDGVGLAEKSEKTSRGLKYMHLRAGLIGASVKWTSPYEGKGTRVEILLPHATTP
jgi:signal transduction histidine kinase